MKLLNEWTENWEDKDFMQFYKQLSNLDSKFVRQLFRLYLHQKQINSHDTFQEKIVAENEFLNDFQLDETIFDLTIESERDECFLSMVDETNNHVPETVQKPDSNEIVDETVDDIQDCCSNNAQNASDHVDDDDEDLKIVNEDKEIDEEDEERVENGEDYGENDVELPKMETEIKEQSTEVQADEVKSSTKGER